MHDLLIEKNVPIPAKRGGRISVITPTLKAMLPGDSFFVATPELTKTVRLCCTRFAKRHGGRFTIQKVPGGHRCWRIE